MQLLDPSSGIQGHAHNGPIIHGDDAISTEEFFRKLNATPLFAPPGTKWEYANENFYLAAVIVQNVTRQELCVVFAAARPRATAWPYL